MHITCIYESENCFSFPSIPIVVRWGEVRWKVYCIRHEGERGVRRVVRLVYRYVLLLCAIVVYGMVWYYYYCGTAAACITFNINFYTYIFFFCIKTFRSFISYLFIVVVVAVDCACICKHEKCTFNMIAIAKYVLIENAFIWWSQRYLFVISPPIIRDLHDYLRKRKVKESFNALWMAGGIHSRIIARHVAVADDVSL